MTIGQSLNFGYAKLQPKNISSFQLDAEILLSFITKKPREFLLAHTEKPLTTNQAKRYSILISRRAKYEPVAYLIGKKDFYGLEFKVNKNVLIPRPETESLIDEILLICKQPQFKKPVIFDIGTGSGVIALTLKKALPKAQIWALEASREALLLASQNAKKYHLNIKFLKSDLLARAPVKLLGGSILAVNLPYVSKAEIASFKPEIKLGLKFEPASAIFANQDGTAVYEKLFRQISKLQAKPAYLVAEIGSYHSKKFLALAKKYFTQAQIKLKKDLANKPRFLIIKF